MNYEDFKAAISAIDLEELGARNGLSTHGVTDDSRVDLRPLNPYFGYRVQEYSSGISMNWGVTDIYWSVSTNSWDRGKFYFRLIVTQRDYKDKVLFECDSQHDLTNEQRDAVFAFVRKWADEQCKKIAARYEQGKQEISIDELQTECEKIANEILEGKRDKYGNKMRARLSVGKRGCDNLSKPYTALCIEYYANVFGRVDWHCEKTMTFFKDKYGINQISYRAPLCGECRGKFDMDEFKQYIQSCLR